MKKTQTGLHQSGTYLEKIFTSAFFPSNYQQSTKKKNINKSAIFTAFAAGSGEADRETNLFVC